MARDGKAREAPTRRACLKGGGTLIGGGLLAGCSSNRSTTTSPSPSPATSTETTTTSTTEEDESYTVTMSPVGEVEFDDVPEKVMTYSPLYADAAVALGHGGVVDSLGPRATGRSSTSSQ